MKSILIGGLLACAISTQGLAQIVENAPQPASSVASAPSLFSKGITMINVGAGAGLNYSGFGYSYSKLNNVSSWPALSLSFERGLIEGIGPGVIGVGGLLGYKHYSWQSSGVDGAWEGMVVTGRGTYHYDLLHHPKLDTYAGVSIGIRREKYRYENLDISNYSSYSRSGIAFQSGLFVGGRYFMSNTVGAFMEVGYDVSYLKLGLTARF